MPPPRQPGGEPEDSVRLLIVILVLVLLVVVDQFRLRGYYTSQLSYYVTQAVRSVI